MQSRLKCFHNDGANEVNIFIHGYSPVSNAPKLQSLVEDIGMTEPRGQCYILHWKSGEKRANAALLASLRHVRHLRHLRHIKIMNPTAFAVEIFGQTAVQGIKFRFAQKKAEKLGLSLEKRVKRVVKRKGRSIPVNLWGHSLGARAIYWSLKNNSWRDVNLQNVVLMGGATSVKNTEEWKNCAAKVKGTFANCYSRQDKVLRFLKFEKCIGRHPIDVEGINDNEFPYKHNHYWRNLDEVALEVLPNRKLSENYSPR